VISLSDRQLAIVMEGARPLPPDKRDVFLWRVSSRLQLQRGFNDADVDVAVRAALKGLIQESAA
jgi:hypothetical protein